MNHGLRKLCTYIVVSIFSPLVSADEVSFSLATGKNPKYRLEVSGSSSGWDKKATLAGRGQVMLKGPVLVTSGRLAEVSTDSVQVNNIAFTFANPMKFCGKNGEPAPFSAFSVGEDVKVTSVPGQTVIRTLRKGLVQVVGAIPEFDILPSNYLCK